MQTILNFSITNPFLLVFISFILGTITILINSKMSNCTKNMTISLIVLPPLVCSALLAINGNLGTSIAILGVFSLVRFRSVPGTSKDIANVFFAMVIGLLVSTGYILTAGILVLILSFISFLINMILKNENDFYELKITVPEDMNFEDEFDKILSKYFAKTELLKIKTTNMGTLFEISYKVSPKNNLNKKEMFNDLRSHNGNLNILYFKSETNNQLL